MGVLMAETFKRMELGHMNCDGWGNYAEYLTPIRNMQLLMRTVLENSAPGSLGNEGRIHPTCDNMANKVRDQVAHEKNKETVVGQSITFQVDNNKNLDDGHSKEEWGPNAKQLKTNIYIYNYMCNLKW